MTKRTKYLYNNKAYSIDAKYPFEDRAITNLGAYQGSIKNP